MTKEELVKTISKYMDGVKPYFYNKHRPELTYMPEFTEALFNGKINWYQKSIADDSDMYEPGQLMPCHGNIVPDDGTWFILGVTQAGKLVEFEGQRIETE